MQLGSRMITSFKGKKVRINAIELRKTNYKNEFNYEFVKWQKNEYFGKLEEYLSNGYKLSPSGESIRNGCRIIDLSMFKLPEHCYVIAWLKKHKEGGYDMETVGDRLIDLSEEERGQFFELYKEFADRKNKRNGKGKNLD